jgi:signal transduction histidine kinase
MAKILNSLTARVILIGLAIQAVLLPLLFYGLLYIVEQSHEERFVNDVRKYSRFIADFIESRDVLNNRMQAVQLLDSAVLGSDGVIAELIAGDIYLRSELSPNESASIFKEDYSFGQHGDEIYFLSTPLNIPGQQAVLRMGFDEQPTTEQIESARQRLAVVLFSYLIVSMLALILLSTRVTRPLRVLQKVSRNIAEGQHRNQLKVDSPLTEIRALTKDLEAMRSRLVDMNASLIQKIAERDEADKQRKSLESKLRQSQKLETVGVLAGGIAHEFNNILLSIFLYTEQAIHDLPAESPTHKHLERVLKSSKRAKDLVQQILTFSRQTGTPEYKLIDVRPVIKEVLDLLRALIPSTVELNQELAADEYMIRADRNQIHQLIMNLCSNAYQALDDDRGSITVALESVVVDEQLSLNQPNLHVGRYVRLSIHDTGHGIERSKLDRIFEPFYTTRTVGKGTGLGLSVVHGIVMSHNGDITIESEPGKGTTFHVYLPMNEQVS